MRMVLIFCMIIESSTLYVSSVGEHTLGLWHFDKATDNAENPVYVFTGWQSENGYYLRRRDTMTGSA